MGKTFKRNDDRYPKWNKHGKKFKKLKEFEDQRFKHHFKSILNKNLDDVLPPPINNIENFVDDEE